MNIKPTFKSPEIESFMTALVGESRETAMQSETGPRCIGQPFGCGERLGNMEAHFKDQRSFDEYRISGLCQNCQDRIFGS